MQPLDIAPLILPFAGVLPVFGGSPRPCGTGSSVLGRARIGDALVLGRFATIRADGNTVTIGDGVYIGESSTVHIAQDLHPTIVGDRVAVGRNTVIHACTIGADCAIEDDVVVLDGTEVGEGVLIEGGSTVYPRSRLEAHGRYAGSPAVLIGTVSPDERARRTAAIRAAAERSANRPADGTSRTSPPCDAHFVAATAVLSGRADLAPGASVFFGCRLRAGGLTLGTNTNIQDNCVIETSGEVVIGHDTTLGHNVRMAHGRIGAGSLVGIGAVLAEGTVVEDDVLVAAGTETLAGQVLDTGWLWGSRPAKPLKRLDDARRAMMAETVRQYVGYGHAYRDAQTEAAERRSVTR